MSGFANDVLVSTEWLAEHLADDGVVVVEVDEVADVYDEGHVPGAARLHWRDDLQDPVVRDVASRAALERALGAVGIASDTTVVLYGDKSNWFAAYAYWILKLHGHRDARILDGGRQKWVEEGRELSVEPASPAAATYVAGARDESLRVHRDEVMAKLDAEGTVLVDVRSPQEYAGELLAPPGYENEGASRAGHIPGAVSIPWATALRDDGTFKPADELRALYAGKDVTPDREVLPYCRIGERSAHTWFVLHELLGYPTVRNYDGSWTEWGSLVGAPIER